MYIRGKDRFDLISAIDHPIHIIGSGSEIWRKYLPKTHSHIIHAAVSYEEALNVMKQAKIVLNSCAWIKNGTHERILAAIASGAAVITSENIYMRENFVHEKDILFYQHRDLLAVNSLIAKALIDHSWRLKIVENGRHNIAENHTWDVRAITLINELQRILPEFSSRDNPS
jgi:spore maturation protein CgeB